MRVPDLLADLFAPEPGEFRPDSPAVRLDEIQRRRAFSPLSPHSPLPSPANDRPPPTTRADLRRLHGEIVAGCRTLDVLEQADPDELAELRSADALAGFACTLVADRRVRPLPPTDLPPLERLAVEIGDEPGELRRWLDQSAVGRQCRARIEREPGAVDRCLIAARDDPDGPLLLALARALAGDRTAEPVPDRPADGRVRNPFGAWRTVEAHAAVAAYDAHHWCCTICRRAGSGYGARCAEGERLHAESVAIAMAIQASMAQRHGGDRKTDQVGNISHLNERGRSRDIAARAAGLGSGKTLEGAP